MTTPTPPAAAPTPRTDAVNECAKRLILNRPFGSSTADLLQELADLYLAHARGLEMFLEGALANNEPWRQKLIKLQAELAAKDVELAQLREDRARFRETLFEISEAVANGEPISMLWAKTALQADAAREGAKS